MAIRSPFQLNRRVEGESPSTEVVDTGGPGRKGRSVEDNTLASRFVRMVDEDMKRRKIGPVLQKQAGVTIQKIGTFLACFLPVLFAAFIMGLGWCYIPNDEWAIACSSPAFYHGAAAMLVMVYVWSLWIFLVGALMEWLGFKRMSLNNPISTAAADAGMQSPVTRF